MSEIKNQEKENEIKNEDSAVQVLEKEELREEDNQEEVETFDEPAINVFKDTLKKVFTMWDEMFKEK